MQWYGSTRRPGVRRTWRRSAAPLRDALQNRGFIFKKVDEQAQGEAPEQTGRAVVLSGEEVLSGWI